MSYLRPMGDEPAPSKSTSLSTPQKVAIGHASFWGLAFGALIVWKLWDDRQYRKGRGIYSYRRK